MFMSSVDVPSGTDFSEMGEDDDFTWYQSHFEGWGAQDFEGHATMVMHNATGRAVPLTWLLLESHSKMGLIANPKMMLNIRKVQGEDSIWVH